MTDARTFRQLRRHAFLGGLALGPVLLCGRARAETPLFEEEPYDVITLNAANDNRVLKIKPLNVGENDPDERPPFTGKLESRRRIAGEGV